MADEEQLVILRQGVEAWNAWYRERPNGANLVRANLREAKLGGADLRRADLREVKLRGADLRGAKLNGAKLERANLRGAMLNGAELGGADLREAELGGAELERADLRGAMLNGADLERADLRGAKLGGADLRGADLREVKLSEANLRGAKLIRADLRETELNKANFRGADLREANLRGANLVRANLHKAELNDANLREADLERADLRKAKLNGADLERAKLNKADLREAELVEVNLRETDLGGADLCGANLIGARLIGTRLSGANLTGCRVYGMSAWDLHLEGARQANLIVTKPLQLEITVDNLEMAEFIYLVLNNERIRHVVDTITSKVVLILGRFTAERKAVLDALREEVRKRDYLPVLFDFERPAGQTITETVSLLARMARFVVADITDAKSIPQELGVIVPDLPSVPVLPLLLEGSGEYSMFEHFRRYPWVLPMHVYGSPQQLIANLSERVIDPAEAKAREFRTMVASQG